VSDAGSSGITPLVRKSEIGANMEHDKKWLNIGEAARHIGMSVAFLRKATRTRSVPYARLGTKSLRFDREALDAWIVEHSSGGELAYSKHKGR
jgi:excisionase family DNA binding protein